MKRKKTSFLILTVVFIACNNKPIQPFLLPDSNDINDIVEAVIYQDSLNVLKNYSPADTIYATDGSICLVSHDNLPFSSELSKLKIFVPDKLIDTPQDLPPPPPPISSLNIGKLLHTKINNKEFFLKEDSLYFLFQNDILQHFTIDKRFEKRIITTNTKELQEKVKCKEMIQYYHLSIPIFSLDRKKAFVEITYCMTGLGGYCDGIFLEKLKDKWTIIFKEKIWVS